VQCNKDIRESLAAEVAEKHDEVIALRRMIQHLTETCREAEIMVRFKDDIIKQMRKDLKASEFKVSTLSCSGPIYHLVWSFHYKRSCHHLTN
jgi:t-SNARE complex subunit (syntaxin)